MGNLIRRPVARFEDFEVHLETGEVWKASRSLKIQDQPFKLLAALLERPGEIVTREELRQRIWPENSFGDFDHAINLAMGKLRATLGDSADVPHLIETVPRRGYRFIAPLKEDTGIVPPLIAPLQENTDPFPAGEKPTRTVREKLWWIVGALAFILLSAVALLRIFPTSGKQPPTAGEIVPLVSMPGRQSSPAVSPDGSRVALAYSGAPHPGIYVALIDGDKPLQLTDNDHDNYPTWSPDGRQIAFARFQSNDQKSLYVIPALGGSERRVYTASFTKWSAPSTNGEPRYCNKMDWSPDGNSLIFSESVDKDTKTRLTLLSLSDLTARPFTSPRNQESDCSPVFSPDGTTVAFARSLLSGFLSDVFLMQVVGGQPLRLTTGNSGGDAAWTQDGSEIVFASPAKGFWSLWRMSASGGTPQRVAGPADAYEPSISRRANQLAYQVWKRSDTIWRLDLKDERHALAPPSRLLSGRGFAGRPSYSPDGKKVVFQSNRMGYSDVWVCDSDGSNCSQLTALHGRTGTARWSPNGRYISFESIGQDDYQVGVVEVPDGIPHMLVTFPGVNNGAPNWSRDGRWIYFYSSHDPVSSPLWKMPSQGGPPVRATTHDGVYGIESMDGRFLYYAKFAEPGIWKKPLDGGQESRVPINNGWWTDWDVARDGIYFMNLDFPPNGRIEFFDFAHGHSTPIFALDKPCPLASGLALSPDGKSLLFGQTELIESDIMVMKNFR
jgi:Tol biopolymer transport system component/DNA-binding winged helix-turn-helix (wHTH) protein